MIMPEQAGASPQTASRFPAGEPAIAQPPVVEALPLQRAVAHSYFWGGVITGTLAAITFSIMSYALMFGCGVGVYSGGGQVIGWGSTVWIVITTCLAYLLGAYIAAQMSALDRSGWQSGLGVWGLSVPLVLVIAAVVAGGAGLAAGVTGSQVTQTVQAAHVANYGQMGLTVAYGQAWTLFTSLLIGGIFAVIGGMIGNQAKSRAVETTIRAR